jgi:hypothetical protein
MRALKYLLILCLLVIPNCREGIVEFDNTTVTGDLFITSNPNGAEILFNYAKTGKTTPDSLVRIQPGNYSVTVRLLGYGEETVNVDVIAGQTKHVNVKINY